MKFALIAIAWWMLGQVPAEQDRYGQPEPKLRPRQPPARIDEPAEDRRAEPSLDPPPVEPRTRQPAEHQPADREPHDAGATQAPAAHGKPRPPDVLTQALEKPVEGALVGTPVTLLAAISRSHDRQQQLKIAQAYWRLSTAQAEYHWALDQRDRLAHYTREHTNSAGTLSARAAARADVRDAQLGVAQAQEELVELLGMHTDASPPLASDRPHVGDFHTYYDTLFANRQPPPRIRLIHRTLPVRRQAIDAHCEAIVAALDAWDATGEHFQQTGQGLATVLATLEELKRERRLFISDVRDYNQEFAEYAFATAPSNADGKTLTEMLIISTPRAAVPVGKGPKVHLPTPPADGPRDEAEPREGEPAEPAERREQTTQYQPAAHEVPEEQALYQGLHGITDPPQRVYRLASLLHWDRNLPADAGEPVTLADCLRGVPQQHRQQVIAAYWQTRERAARFQVLSEQVELLNVLPAIAISLRSEPGMAEATVRLQAARRAAHAAVLDAHAALLVAQFNLMQVTGRRLDGPWILPSTLPQSGRYLAPASTVSDRTRAKHLSAIIYLEHEKLEERADAIIHSDAHRAAVVNDARAGADARVGSEEANDEPMRIDGAVRTIRRQGIATLNFLSDLTAYNMAIAQFALIALPPTISNDDLVKKLVVARSTRRET